MPTVIHFVGAEEAITIEEDYDEVCDRLSTSDHIQVTRLLGHGRRQAMIYKWGIAYVQDLGGVQSPRDSSRNGGTTGSRNGPVAAPGRRAAASRVVTHFALQAVDGDMLGTVALSRPSWRPGSVIYRGG